MEKRYQVFVSSTYTDLIDERVEVMQALLELDCMPAGMELFPAASEEQWNWIKRVIDESDYYIVIVGGRYGTISEATGMSYTEMEYRYALDIGKPVIGFLHEVPSKIEAGKTENSPQVRKKLEQFRRLIEQRLCKYWSTPADLGAKASRRITQLIKHRPAVGWIRADQVPTDSSREVLELKRQIETLQEQLRQAHAQSSLTTHDLAQGKNRFALEYSFHVKQPKKNKAGTLYWVSGADYDAAVETTWDDLFSYVTPKLISGMSEYQVVRLLNSHIEHLAQGYFEETFPERRVVDVRIYSEAFDKIKIQFRALGLINIDEDGNWVLTLPGDEYMVRLLAVHRTDEQVNGWTGNEPSA